MLSAVKKGKPVNEAEIPPPVATGAPSAAPQPSVPARPAPPVPTRSKPTASDQQVESEGKTSPPEIITPTSEGEQSSSTTAPILSSLPSPEEQTEEPAKQPQSSKTDGQFVLDYTKWKHIFANL